VWRYKCSRWHQIDLTAMVRDGQGDKAIADLNFRCRECGAVGSKTVQAVDVGVVTRYMGGGMECF
jgi:hypothetical protein